jgi:hypothetical protein
MTRNLVFTCTMQVHLSQATVSSVLDKLAHMETLVNDRLSPDRASTSPTTQATSLIPSISSTTQSQLEELLVPSCLLQWSERWHNGKALNVSSHYKFRACAYLMGSSLLSQVTIDCFEEQWVISRGTDGRPDCVQNTCAHRACPLHLGSVNEGRIQCPYHGKNGKSHTATKNSNNRVHENGSHFFSHVSAIWFVMLELSSFQKSAYLFILSELIVTIT